MSPLFAGVNKISQQKTPQSFLQTQKKKELHFFAEKRSTTRKPKQYLSN